MQTYLKKLIGLQHLRFSNHQSRPWWPWACLEFLLLFFSPLLMMANDLTGHQMKDGQHIFLIDKINGHFFSIRYCCIQLAKKAFSSSSVAIRNISNINPSPRPWVWWPRGLWGFGSLHYVGKYQSRFTQPYRKTLNFHVIKLACCLLFSIQYFSGSSGK